MATAKRRQKQKAKYRAGGSGSSKLIGVSMAPGGEKPWRVSASQAAWRQNWRRRVAWRQQRHISEKENKLKYGGET
jgi:hypothetical protein